MTQLQSRLKAKHTTLPLPRGLNIWRPRLRNCMSGRMSGRINLVKVGIAGRKTRLMTVTSVRARCTTAFQGKVSLLKARIFLGGEGCIYDIGMITYQPTSHDKISQKIVGRVRLVTTRRMYLGIVVEVGRVWSWSLAGS